MKQQPRPKTLPGYWHLYVISELAPGGFVKVGMSRDVYKRLYGLQTANPRTLRLELLSGPFDRRQQAADQESTIHDLLLEYRCRGEWFRMEALSKIREIYCIDRDDLSGWFWAWDRVGVAA